MDASTLIITALAAGLAGFTQGFAGFGSTLAALPLLGAILPVRTAVPVSCLMALCINLLLTSRLKADIRWRPLVRILACSLPGMVLGALVLGLAPALVLKAMLGAAVLLLSLRTLRAPLAAPKPGPLLTVGAGFLAGFFGVCIGINGPQVVAWATRQSLGRDGFKATLAAYFLLAGVVIVGLQAWDGLLDQEVLSLFVLSLPALGVGLWAGYAASGRMSEEGFLKMVQGLLGLTGAVLLGQAFLAWVTALPTPLP